jgi:hypothetical protein
MSSIVECVILFRNPYNNSVGFVSKEDGEIEVFPHVDAAMEAVETVPILRAAVYQIVELDDL